MTDEKVVRVLLHINREVFPFAFFIAYCWCVQVDEVYKLLSENYVEDDDNMFRFDYSRDFLRW